MSEQLLAAEMVTVVTLDWIFSVGANKQAPTPENMLGPIVAYTALAGVAMFGANAAKLAAGLGALVLLTVAVTRFAPNITASPFLTKPLSNPANTPSLAPSAGT